MPSVEEALKISQDFLEFAKEVRANNVIKEQQEEEKTVLKVKVNCQFVRIFSNTHTHIEYTFPHLHIWHALAHVHCASVQICKIDTDFTSSRTHILHTITYSTMCCIIALTLENTPSHSRI